MSLLFILAVTTHVFFQNLIFTPSRILTKSQFKVEDLPWTEIDDKHRKCLAYFEKPPIHFSSLISLLKSKQPYGLLLLLLLEISTFWIECRCFY